MKKLVLAVLALSIALGVLAVPRRAHAAFGVATGNIPEIVVGAVLTAGALAMPIVIDGMKDEENPTRSNVWYWLTLLSGIMLLEEEKGKHDVAFGPLTERGALKVAASPEEVEYYNHDLQELNAVRETILGETLDRLRRGEKLTVKHVQKMWQRYEDVFAPQTLSAARKIARQLREPAVLPQQKKPARNSG